ncbi:Ig-like domain-containing protein [Paractinoplanes atraurantiacus]|uniref:Ig-like domain-containing protein n=2 Tax=Paractinoplanes atraurantiacus TaxID=1036182 RepID=A0A285HRI4_9ACTN|nr:Ig-like domain-containing protein [Actinoplanes atraurantiacus]
MVLALVAALLVVPQAARAATCPCSIWPTTAVPSTPSEADTAAVEVGVKFRSDADGFVTGVRFYKGSANTGTHVGHLWSATGTNLGTVTFTGETASGWQTATFASPVAISANTTYVASYYAPNGRYASDDGAFATAGVDNSPLRALRDGEDGANGIYRYGTGGGFPTNTYQSANYWVDVVFETSAADTTPPTVTGTSPASGDTGVATTATISATLNEPLQAGTVALALRTGTTTINGTTAYDSTTRTVSLVPAGALAASTSYTATVSGARDVAGNTMAPVSWSFTTGSGGSACPCTIWPPTATPAVAAAADNSAVELGVRFRANAAGFITGLRFYKGAGNTGTHTGSLWSTAGTRLSTVTFTGETATGWQTATLPNPVAVTANTTYVASYHTDTGFYSTTANGLASAVTRGPLSTIAGNNGVYRYGASAYPTASYQNTNYWVDVVYNTAATDTVAPGLAARSPAAGASGVAATTAVTATFNEPVSAVAMSLTGPSGAVTGTTAYDAGSNTATFTPSATLAYSTAYTVSVSDARDAAGNVMTPVTWTFTTGTAPPPPPDQGPGGPILLIRPPSGFTPFLAEVLRTEGLNEFTTADLSTVTATTLSQYDVVLLGQTALTAAQVAMFTTWVDGGGNLIAMRPDKQLAGLLGLTSTTGTLAEGYLKAASPGIADQTIQYHGTADRYTLNGAQAVATLYSNATTATTNPAVSLAGAGANGGQAAAFTYDLPQSLVYTRQGNPAWDGQERDGSSPRRSDDLFFGGGSTDWVNLSKAAIPQADEQQRLLANLIGQMNLDRKPLPKFWYFPRGVKAVVVATGDDHGVGGTAGRFDQYTANSPANCVVDDWQCARFTSYVYPASPLTGAQAGNYQSRGFEVGLHVTTNCGDFTASTLTGFYTNQLSSWRGRYSGVTGPVTNRTHCIAWSDWSSQATIEAANGIRLDTNYYYWPGSWVNDRPGFMTGSGMPMRFSPKTGGLIDVYQAATQMTDESGQSYPFTVDTLLDRALGAEGYYGAFTANMHTDNATTYDSDQVLASARERGVPLITAKQLLAWLDGRNASSYSAISWSGNELSFTVNVGTGANGLTGMVPTLGPGGRSLTTLTRAGSPVAFTKTTIKGIEYGMYAASPGAYVATYSGTASPVAPSPQRRVTGAPDTTAPAISDIAVQAQPDGTATVSWSTSEPAATTLEVEGNSWPADLTGRSHTATVTGLDPLRTYQYRIRGVDPAGNATVSPVDTFVSSAAGVADHTEAALRTGKASGVTVTADGARLTGNTRKGSMVSRVLDAKQMVTWDRLSYQASVPEGASVRLSVRTGSTSSPGGSGWTGWKPAGQGDRVVGGSRYAQYRVELTRGAASPVLHGVGITSDAKPVANPTETGR